MKIKISELQGAALDWAVAKCEGKPYQHVTSVTADKVWKYPTRYSTDWAQGGPIIEREKIDTYTQYPCVGATVWYGRHHGSIKGTGPTPLIAAMRCYVQSKLGDEVDVPNELLN